MKKLKNPPLPFTTALRGWGGELNGYVGHAVSLPSTLNGRTKTAAPEATCVRRIKAKRVAGERECKEGGGGGGTLHVV